MSTKESLAKAEMKAKGKPLQKMFNKVPESYDFLNRLLTFRMDEHWRKKAVQKILEEKPSRVMDLGTGTGDMAVRIAKKNKEVKVTGYDFSSSMLKVAEIKAKKSKVSNVHFVEGDAAEMPFNDNEFDVVGISFAFRNITFKNPNTSLYLREIFRVLRPCGKLIIVESSQPNSSFIRKGFHFYLKNIVSGIGGRLSKSRGAYHYLAYSAREFYTRKELTRLLTDFGFEAVEHMPLFCGAAAVSSAIKPAYK